VGEMELKVVGMERRVAEGVKLMVMGVERWVVEGEGTARVGDRLVGELVRGNDSSVKCRIWCINLINTISSVIERGREEGGRVQGERWGEGEGKKEGVAEKRLVSLLR